MTPGQMVAKAVARERMRAGVSLSALAEKAGLSKSTLSQLEAGRGNPSIETLWSIARALDIPFSFFFETSTKPTKLIRADIADDFESATQGLSAMRLANFPPTHRCDLYRMTVQHGETHHGDPHSDGSVEHAMVVSGELRIGPPDASEVLRPGDYFRYPADAPHIYEAVSEEAVVLLAMESRR